jgi:hypothetical protein
MQSQVEEKINLASALSLASGITILLGSILYFWMYTFMVSSISDLEEHHHMMGAMMSFLWPSGAFWLFFLIGLFSGGIVFASSILLKIRAKDRFLYGSLIIIFSVLSIFSGGGFIVGALLGLLSGIVAVI